MKILKTKELYIFSVVLLLFIIIGSVNSKLFTYESVADILRTLSIPGILAIGVLLVMLSGGVDISFGAVATVAMFVSGKFIVNIGGNIFSTFVIGILTGLILGAINGILVSKLKIPTIIATLGTLSIFRGTLLLVTGGTWILDIPDWFIDFGRRYIFGIPIQAYFYIAIVIITWIILKYTAIGRGIYALGGNEESAFRIGFNVFKLKMFIYMYAGALAGMAGVLNTSLAEIIDPRSFTGIEFPVIAAVVLGGASIFGGVGSVFGTIIGSLFVAIMNRGLVLMKISSFWHEIIIGFLILISITIDVIQNNIRKMRRTMVSID
jgi:simple sugar transport system permease protein